MVLVEVSVEISKPLDEVFSYVTNFAHAFAWRSTLMAITDTPQEAMRVGYTFREQSKLLDRVVSTIYEVVEWIPSRRFTYKSIVGIVSSLVCVRFEPTTRGTQVTMSVEQSFDLVFPQTETLAMRAAQRILQVDVQTLKDIVEGR
jgi:uncharacterized membrane protein